MSAIVNKIANFIGFDMEEDVDYMEVNEKQEEKVVKFNELRNKKNQQKIYTQEVFEYVLLHLKSYEDVTRIADEIKANKMVTFNLAGLEFETARRVLDFISGVAYYSQANISKVSDHAFTAAPKYIKISNELPVKESGNEILDKKRNTSEEEIVRGK
ncbi:MAG: cell division protein SepF [Fusobacteria bacterium]|nr:cell division protein SepF [Fusobacteriota bacterium]